MNFSNAFQRLLAILQKPRTKAVYVERPSGATLSGKIALISGGTGGIGFAIAQAFSAEGCKCVLTSSSEARLLSACRCLGGNVDSSVLDLTAPESIEDRVQELVERFGCPDILVNAAGIRAPAGGFMSLTPGDWDRVMSVNLKGPFFLSRCICGKMIERGIRGHVLNISSASALRPAWNVYEISKWGMNGFTKGLADSMVGKGIVVNAIGPGPVATPMLGWKPGDSIDHPSNPAGRWATPREIADLAVYLVSGKADMIVGETVYISGGGGTISFHR